MASLVGHRRHVKASRARRKFVNDMRGMGDVPWPARRFKYPATLAAAVTSAVCPRLVTVDWQRRKGLLGWVRKPLAQPRICGAPLVMVPHGGARLSCPECARRAKRERLETRFSRAPVTGATLALRAALEVAKLSHRIFHRRSA